MQTFLPYPDFELSACSLDYRRLGKQRVEAFQIHNVLQQKKLGLLVAWRNHPAVLMWEGYEDALLMYMSTCIKTWVNLGYNNSMQFYDIKYYELPKWFGNSDIHASHRSNLLRKNFEFYSKYKWKESSDLEYYWPVNV